MSRKDKKRLAAAAAPAPSESPALNWLWAAGIIWAVFVCFHFYKKQPFSYLTILNQLLSGNGAILPTFAALFGYIKGVASFFILAGSAFFLGRLLLFRFKSWGSSLELAVFSTALGYGVLAYITLGLAATGLLYKEGIRVGVVVLFVAGAIAFWRSAEREKFRLLPSEIGQTFFPGGAGTVLGILLLFLLLTDFVMAFVPELFYDALVYHLGAPNFYLQEHRLAPIHLMTAKFPFTIQMIHLLGLALQDEMVTKLTHLFLMVLLVGGMLAFGLRTQRRFLGVLAALAFCSIPTVQMNVWTSGVDMGVSLFGFLAFFGFYAAFEKEEPDFSWFVFSAIFAGLAAASKYTTAYIPASIGLTMFVLIFLKRISFRRALIWLAVFSAVVIAILLPWFVKNWFETGNPLYPFLSHVFGGEALAPWRYEILRNENQGLIPKNIWSIPKMLWDLCISERSSLSFQGPMFLAWLPFSLAVFFRDRPRSLRTLNFFVLIVCVLALSMTRLTRYVLPAFTALACFLAYGLDDYLSAGPGWRRTGVLFVVALCFLQQVSWAYMLIGNSFKPQPLLSGRESRFDYANRYHPGMNPNPPNQMYQYMEKTFTDANRVLLVGEEKGYPLQVRHTYSGVYDRGILIRLCEELSTPEDVAAALLDQGITHVMVNVFEANRLAGYGIFSMSPKAFGLFCAFWESHLKFAHLELHPESDRDKNPLILLEVTRAGLTPTDRPVQNVIAPIYDRVELLRLGFNDPGATRAFYEERLKEWPQVIYLNNRVKELR